MSLIDKFHSIKILWIYLEDKINYILSSKKKGKKERNKNRMKPLIQRFDVKNDAKLTSWLQGKTSTSDDRIKLFSAKKTINLSKIRLTLLNYDLSKNDKFKIWLLLSADVL